MTERDHRDKVLLIAMPTLGEIATPTVKCLIGLTQALARSGVPFAFQTYEFSDIVFSRNQLMCIFHTQTRFTHMLMLDSDMAVEPEAIWRLMDFGADFAATAYPQKHPRWGRLRALIESEASLPQDEKSSIEQLLSRTWVYNHQRSGFGGTPWVPSSCSCATMRLESNPPDRRTPTGPSAAKRRRTAARSAVCNRSLHSPGETSGSGSREKLQ